MINCLRSPCPTVRPSRLLPTSARSQPHPKLHRGRTTGLALSLAQSIALALPLSLPLSLPLWLATGPGVAHASEAEPHPAIKRSFQLPPNVTLHYSIKAKQKGFPLSGESRLSWHSSERKYRVDNEIRANLFGKLQESASIGSIDDFGLAPLQFTEKRWRKEPTETRFERGSSGKIRFSEAPITYPLHGGEQDRTSILWQLVAIARSNADKFVPQSEWVFFVAGRRDAEAWTFRVQENTTINTPLGKLASVHLVKKPPPDSQDQQLDIWLAPAQEWYPVRLRFADADGDFVEQNLEKIEK